MKYLNISHRSATHYNRIDNVRITWNYGAFA